VEREEAGDPLPDAPGGVALAVRMHSGVEQGRPLGVLDQVSGDRQIGLTLPALHQVAKIPSQVAAGQGEELQAQVSLLGIAQWRI
jgi:hypothetical protein